jgi:hypothetical protein
VARGTEEEETSGTVWDVNLFTVILGKGSNIVVSVQLPNSVPSSLSDLEITAPAMSIHYASSREQSSSEWSLAGVAVSLNNGLDHSRTSAEFDKSNESLQNH